MEDYKKKYEDALSRAREMCAMPIDKATMEYVFPELKESEDERIRKSLLNEFTHLLSKGCNKFAGLKHEDIITWLENQGKQKPPVIDFKAKNWYVSKVDGKIYDMTYNPTDNIEPKFKVGDWIAWEELNTAKIVNIDGDRYEVEFIDGNKGFPHIDYIDRLFHLWTIQDAKDGDVLVADDLIVLFKKRLENDSILTHFHYDTIDDECEPGCRLYYADIYPATKEQRELLFKKMEENGYAWDAEKKEMKLLISNGGDFEPELSHQEVTKKSEQGKEIDTYSLLFHKDDRDYEVIKLIRSAMLYCPHMEEEDRKKVNSWLKSIKQRLQ